LNIKSDFKDENHQLIHRYGCSVARKQVQDDKIENQQDELPTIISCPTQSQSSPVIHFAHVNFD